MMKYGVKNAWSITQAVLFCFVIGSMYVVALYLIPQRIRKLARDNLIHMQYRMATSVISTILSLLLFIWLVPIPKGSSHCVALGLCTDALTNKLMTTLLLMLLFYLGPLATFLHYIVISLQYVVKPSGICTLRGASQKESMVSIVFDIMFSEAISVVRGSAIDQWMTLRALIFAPITEELVYRSVLAPALYLALTQATVLASPAVAITYSPWTVVWVNPFWFGLAHVHHLIEKINTGWQVSQAVVSTLVQLIYTSIFGFIATLLLLRTGTIYTSILSHIVCNSVGLPDISFMHAPGSGSSAHYSCMYSYRYLHLGLHAAGLVTFSLLILPFTEEYAEKSMYWF